MPDDTAHLMMASRAALHPSAVDPTEAARHVTDSGELLLIQLA
jgi:hypothetical protein